MERRLCCCDVAARPSPTHLCAPPSAVFGSTAAVAAADDDDPDDPDDDEDEPGVDIAELMEPMSSEHTADMNLFIYSFAVCI